MGVRRGDHLRVARGRAARTAAAGTCAATGEEVSALNSYAARPRGAAGRRTRRSRRGAGAPRPGRAAGAARARRQLRRRARARGARRRHPPDRQAGRSRRGLARPGHPRPRPHGAAVGGRRVRADAGRARPRHRVRDRRRRRLVGGHARPLGHLPRRGAPALARGEPADPRRRGGDARRVRRTTCPTARPRLGDRLGMASLRVAESERAAPDLLPKQLDAAWDAFADSVPRGRGRGGDARRCATRPRSPPRWSGPARCTLLHGDLRDDNLGLTEDRVVLLDWDLATGGHAHRGVRLVPLPRRLADRRHARRARGGLPRRRGGAAWTRDEIELGMLSGLVQYGWIFGHSLRIHPDPAERAWARAGARLVGAAHPPRARGDWGRGGLKLTPS